MKQDHPLKKTKTLEGRLFDLLIIAVLILLPLSSVVLLMIYT